MSESKRKHVSCVRACRDVNESKLAHEGGGNVTKGAVSLVKPNERKSEWR